MIRTFKRQCTLILFFITNWIGTTLITLLNIVSCLGYNKIVHLALHTRIFGDDFELFGSFVDSDFGTLVPLVCFNILAFGVFELFGALVSPTVGSFVGAEVTATVGASVVGVLVDVVVGALVDLVCFNILAFGVFELFGALVSPTVGSFVGAEVTATVGASVVGVLVDVVVGALVVLVCFRLRVEVFSDFTSSANAEQAAIVKTKIVNFNRDLECMV